MRLIHHTATPFQFDRKHVYGNRVVGCNKPDGLWVSVEGEDDWESWCRGNDFALERLAYRSLVELKAGANVLHLATLDALDEFHRRFSNGERRFLETLDWPKVAALYDGVIIAPYQWERRLEWTWYYGFDCASGCIWNLDAVASVTEVPQSTYAGFPSPA